jgi:undecaprenyl diphosphate synthase
MSKLKHLGIIMDGNRRWAKNKNLPALEGHKAGYEKVKEVGKWCIDRGIEVLTVYAFSTENWNRSKDEVKYLMILLKVASKEGVEEFNKLGIRINILGSTQGLDKKIMKSINNIQEKTKNNMKGVLNICFNYGGRLEIVEAIREIVKNGFSPEEINEDLVTQFTWLKNQPEPDLIIRTSGEQRLSGFLTWSSVYSELYFTSCTWPAFNEKELDKAIEDFNARHRRFGGN